MSNVESNVEWSPREHGLMIGHSWAQSYQGNLTDLRPTAEGQISDDTRDANERLMSTYDRDNPTAFWGGFSHGVAAFLLDNGIAREVGN